MILVSCSDAKSDKEAEERNSETHVESYSEENISPQLQNNQDSNSRLEVDTISSSHSSLKKKQSDSLN